MRAPHAASSSVRAVRAASSTSALILTLVVSSSVCEREAHATESEAEQQAAALFDQGTDAFGRGDALVALRLFREVWSLVPVPEARWNIVAAEVRLGMKVEAHRDLAEYLAASDEVSPVHLKEAAELRDQLEKQLARLTLEIDPPGALVLLDGNPSAYQTWIAPGEHRVHVTAFGRVTETKRLSLTAGERRTVVIKLAAPPPPPPPKTPQQRIVGLTILGVGVAGLATGTILGGLVLERVATKDALCQGQSPRCPGGDVTRHQQLEAEASRLAEGSNLAFALGGAVSVFGAVVTLTAQQPDPARPKSRGVALSISIVPPPRGEGGVFAFQGEF